MMAVVASQRVEGHQCPSMTADQAAAQAADSAEAPMSQDAFTVIERAHQLCDHPPAIGLAAELEQHAIKIMSAQIRAGELLREMKERGDSDLGVSKTCLVETDSEESRWCESSLVDDETDDPVIDWKSVARDAWDGKSWKDAAMDYRAERGVRP
jgi:hypothetical protein